MTDEQAEMLTKFQAEDGFIGEDQDYNVIAYSESIGRTILIDECGEVWYVARWAPYISDERED